MTSKRELEYRIEQMEQQAAQYGVTFRVGREPVGGYADVAVHYSADDNIFHKDANDFISEQNRALDTLMDLMGVRETYEKLAEDRKRDKRVYFVPLRLFLNDLAEVADSVEAERLRSARSDAEKAARRRLKGKEPKS